MAAEVLPQGWNQSDNLFQPEENVCRADAVRGVVARIHISRKILPMETTLLAFRVNYSLINSYCKLGFTFKWSLRFL
jgi:hypothetical protein